MQNKAIRPRIGIMGGTFDPIHYGHLLMAEEARQAFALDQVVFVPNGRPAHKKAYLVSSPEDRYAMTLLATGSNPCFSCSRIEIERPGPSYTIDTLRAFRELYPDLDAQYFITGADAVLEILTWHEYDKLMQECQFIAVTRPGFVLERLSEIADADFLDRVLLPADPWAGNLVHRHSPPCPRGAEREVSDPGAGRSLYPAAGIVSPIAD